MSLFYPPLTLYSSLQVLELNLKRARTRFTRQKRRLVVEHDQVKDFIAEHWINNPGARWNGRQIRNACQTAIALAEYEARGTGGSGHDVANIDAEDEALDVVNLSVGYFEKVAKEYYGFMEYYRNVYGVDPDTRASELGIRARVGSLVGDGGVGARHPGTTTAPPVP
ncbi:hypothetical protein RB596_007371 [Gaeumannomyces avenae]